MLGWMDYQRVTGCGDVAGDRQRARTKPAGRRKEGFEKPPGVMLPGLPVRRGGARIPAGGVEAMPEKAALDARWTENWQGQAACALCSAGGVSAEAKLQRCCPGCQACDEPPL